MSRRASRWRKPSVIHAPIGRAMHLEARCTKDLMTTCGDIIDGYTFGIGNPYGQPSKY